MNFNQPVIPIPSKIKYLDGYFKLSNATNIVCDSKTNKLQNYLIKTLAEFKSIELNIDQNISNQIQLSISDSGENNIDESYSLIINEKSIEIASSSLNGLFYGCQTLLQLIFSIKKENETITLPAMEIYDSPVFKWRGMHLDVSRHFYPVDFIKKQIKLLAMHKMNIFHWHLTDDQGWRIEIKKYPELTNISAKRRDKNNNIYSGYYTQDEIKEIIAFANDHFVTIIPEIEMPGHSVAALATFPDLSCRKKPLDVANKWGIFEDIYCAGNEDTYLFLENVLKEVIELFPSKFIHIGGDEVPKKRWKNCPLCKTRMKENNLKDVIELQSYFINRIANFVSSYDRQIVVWDDLLESTLPDNSVIMSWRGMEVGISAANSQKHVVMTPTSHCYFDYYQSKHKQPKAIGGYIPLEQVYEFDPIADEITDSNRNYVLGGQCNVWTEYMPNEDHVEYMVYPRLCAMAETLWSNNKKRNFDTFVKRLASHKLLLDFYNVNYFN